MLSPEGRRQSGQFFAEGLRFLGSALDHGAVIDGLLVAPDMLAGGRTNRLLRRCRARGVPVVEVQERDFRSISTAERPQGVGLIVRQRWERPARMRTGDGLCWLALDSVRSRGNLGSIIRTCEATGAAGVILLGDTADPHDPVAVRATMGAIFSRRLVHATPGQLLDWAARHGVQLVGSSPAGVVDYRVAAYRRPLVLLLGGERTGLPPELQRRCDPVVRIPMAGATDSLNVAVAAGILLYRLFDSLTTATSPGQTSP